ncbi:small ribosomal subunit biogenesis GTPase RsgA [Halieaceae bacterium IMCC14734]|uniref:Small ribosomal subunit biogenesis GTPase RsgA n=1 Tax=Candidatus Litorirhabdus singularis TaxID=2518993 RepID=A0ABT3TK77_9GAMM|nr:small ribosomal subunit biogenesis GTPase RsgA [Candidatus Litorirhabdus singularis]MCX2982722.1 small ribosomal subunit biogenesis GTPase RsgA [Candidatus Litorirhabdus singularis]
MSKRKLTRQQSWRIQKIQDERRERAAKREAHIDQDMDSNSLGPEQEGLVIAHFGSQVEVESAAGNQRCHLRANIDSLVTGDRVIWCAGDPVGVVVARQPRNAELLRPDPYGDLKPVAANIDRIFIVIAPLPEPHALLIDRYLVAAEAVGVKAVIVLNKSDMLNPDNRPDIDELLAPYPALGYPVLRVSSETGDAMESLSAELDQHLSIFIGQSGVGKSSLVNTLLPEAAIKIGALSTSRNEGTHTTTTARLFHLPNGGSLIDSPGIREFGLWHMDRWQVEDGFPELRAYLGQCRFRDCHHEQEPGCALLEAAAREPLLQRRLDSFRQIIATLQASTPGGAES